MKRALLALILALCAGSLRAAEPVTIRAGRLLDGRGGMLEDVTVTIQGSRIVSVAPGGDGDAGLGPPGLALMPGGIDTTSTSPGISTLTARPTTTRARPPPARPSTPPERDRHPRPGFEADLIVVEGDPLKDIRAWKRVVWVIKSGKVVGNDRRCADRHP